MKYKPAVIVVLSVCCDVFIVSLSCEEGKDGRDSTYYSTTFVTKCGPTLAFSSRSDSPE